MSIRNNIFSTYDWNLDNDCFSRPNIKTEIREPRDFSVIGSIVSLFIREENVKFRSRTIVIIIETFAEGDLIEVVISTSQWKKFNKGDLFKLGNINTFILKECIENVTGEYLDEDSIELSPHVVSYIALSNIFETPIDDIVSEGKKGGLDSDVINFITSREERYRRVVAGFMLL